MHAQSTSVSLTQQDIEDGLRQLGLDQGDVVEVHSSLSSFGHVIGGAATVIDALMNVVGPEGTLVMSAYPVSPAIPLTEEEKARGLAWKVHILDSSADEPTGMGVIADTFRQRPDAICGPSLHRVCAWGRDAQQHSQGYAQLLDASDPVRDGWALLIGVGIDRCSSMHQAEARVGLPAEIAKIFQVPEDIEKDYPAELWGIGYGSTPDDAWAKVWAEADRRGLIKRQRIGRAECALFKARAVVGIYEEWLRTDPFGLFGVEKGAQLQK